METLLIKRNEVRALLSIEECIAGVEQAFKLRALGKAQPPGILGVHAVDGGFHIKAGILNLGREYFVAKANANFPQNMKRNGLPTIQGVIVVSDATNGQLLALLDSMEITIIRTGAATAVAAKYLANPDAKSITICGCGNQGKISLQAISKVRKLTQASAFDVDEQVANKFALEMSASLRIEVKAVSDLREGTRHSDMIVTCTPSNKFFLGEADVQPGTFIAAVGSDSEHKQELDPRLLKSAKLVADSTEQASHIGELHHALAEGVMRHDDVYGELGEVIAGIKPGRTSKEEIVIFDSTGTALQDVAAAAVVYEKAAQMKIGATLDFSA